VDLGLGLDSWKLFMPCDLECDKTLRSKNCLGSIRRPFFLLPGWWNSAGVDVCGAWRVRGDGW
jgi:hypothetical protein